MFGEAGHRQCSFSLARAAHLRRPAPPLIVILVSFWESSTAKLQLLLSFPANHIPLPVVLIEKLGSVVGWGHDVGGKPVEGSSFRRRVPNIYIFF